MPGPESLSPSDPTAFGDYSVVGRLGKGGQGVVYLARDGEGEEYAIKVLNDQWSQDDDLRKRFEKEVRAAQKVASFCTSAAHRRKRSTRFATRNPMTVLREPRPRAYAADAVHALHRGVTVPANGNAGRVLR